MTITATVQPNVYEDGIDHIYIHGADIADPYNNPDVTEDQSVDPIEHVFVLAVPSSEDEQPYRAALEDVGLTVIGTDSSGDWILSQSRPL